MKRVILGWLLLILVVIAIGMAVEQALYKPAQVHPIQNVRLMT